MLALASLDIALALMVSGTTYFPHDLKSKCSICLNSEIFVAVAHVPIANTLVLVDLMHAGAEVGYVRRNVQKKLKSKSLLPGKP